MQVGRLARGAVLGAALAVPATVLAVPAQAADPAAAQAQTEVVRIAGADRYDTALEISRNTWATDGDSQDPRFVAEAVVLVRGDTFADALTAGPLAAQNFGPVLLTAPDGLPASVGEEIDRILPEGGNVHIVGGPVAVSSEIEQGLLDEGYAVLRHAGANRYDTSVNVAEAMANPTILFFATGNNFPDALSAGAVAGALAAPVLLTDDQRLPDSVRTFADDLSDAQRVSVGGSAAAAVPGDEELFGPDRYDTALAVAGYLWQPSRTPPVEFGLATGENFPDALAGAAKLAVTGGGPLLLTRTAALDPGTGAYLDATKDTLVSGLIFGGPVAVSAAVEDAVRDILAASPA